MSTIVCMRSITKTFPGTVANDSVDFCLESEEVHSLVGENGAGKTTLLDVLAQRKTEGSIKGSIMVDGRPLPISFQRSAGYCEQFDAHETYATVRESLELSALLRSVGPIV